MRSLILLTFSSVLLWIGAMTFILGNLEVGDLDVMRNVSVGAFVVAFLLIAMIFSCKSDSGKLDLSGAAVTLFICGVVSMFIGEYAVEITNPKFVTKLFYLPSFGSCGLAALVWGVDFIRVGWSALKQDNKYDKRNGRTTIFFGAVIVLISLGLSWLKFRNLTF